MNQRVPLRTGRVVYAVAWAVSEGPDRSVLQWGFVMGDGESGGGRKTFREAWYWWRVV